MNKLPKDKRDKIILVALATAGVIAGVWFGLISTQMKSLAAVRQQHVDATQKLSTGNTTLKASQATQDRYNEAAGRLKVEEAGMAASNDMYSWLIQTVNEFRLGYDVEIPQFGRETSADVGPFPDFPYRSAVFTVRGVAFYHDFGKFLADFENKFPYIRVQNLELEPMADQAASASAAREKLSFKMDLLTLVRPIAP